MSRSEAEILKSISIARGTAESAQAEQTDVTEAVDVSEETPEETEAVVEEAVIEAPEATAETEEEASEELTESDSSSDEELYVEIKGREVALSDIEKWENEGLMQADYTRKTQAHAEDVKTFEAERETFNTERATLQGQMKELEVILSEETLSAEALTELREYEPEEYIKYQEKIANRKEMLGQAKATQPVSDVDVAAESKKLFDANPTWVKDGKTTDAFTNDTALMKTYALDIGFTGQEFDELRQAHHMQVILDAAKFQALNKKNASIEKKVRKAPVTTKPRAALKSSLVTKIDAAKKRLKQTGNSDDYMNLRKLQRQAEE